MSRTIALLPVSREAWDGVKDAVLALGSDYSDMFHGDVINLDGVGLVVDGRAKMTKAKDERIVAAARALYESEGHTIPWLDLSVTRRAKYFGKAAVVVHSWEGSK